MNLRSIIKGESGDLCPQPTPQYFLFPLAHPIVKGQALQISDGRDLTYTPICVRLDIGCREPRLKMGSLFVLFKLTVL